MPIATPASLQQNIVNVIKRFKFEEIESSIIPIFPEISWNNIRSELVKHRKQFTSTNVAQLVKTIITRAKLEEKVLRDRLSTLQLIDISWHSNRKIWYGYTSTGYNKSTSYLIKREIRNDIQNYFDSLNMKINVKVNTHDGITYISLTDEKSKSKSKKNIQRTAMLYFALFMGQKYFFCTKKYVSSNILNIIVRSLGSKDSKRSKLMGRDLKSLSELCWKKKEGALNFENVRNALVYKEATPNKNERGIDFTQREQRKKYAEECFGDNPPTLELLVINGPSMPLSHKDVSTKLSNENICTKWEFRSHNIAVFLSKLIERRILVTPVPYYISNLTMLGRNEFTLQIQ